MKALEDIIYPVVEVMHGQQSSLTKDPKTILFGFDAAMDSIALITFLAAVEERVHALTGKNIPLTLDSIEAEENPFDTLGSLAEYLDRRLNGTA
jgi:acyl carrier protein